VQGQEAESSGKRCGFMDSPGDLTSLLDML